MRYAGIDIGSRTVKLVVLEDSRLVLARKAVTSYDPLSTARELMDGVEFTGLTATGYGRHLIKGRLDCLVISEITAFTRGAGFFSHRCRSILDIGGQDTKAIALDEQGEMAKFEMNDKCAAGTGRFLEVMATALGYTWRNSPRRPSPPPVCWQEIYDVIALDPVSTGEEFATLMARIAARLEERIGTGISFGAPSSPRVLVTGCPIGGDALKVLKIIEEAGGVVVALEACSGMKGYSIRVEEVTGDPLRAVAEATLKIPCSCMSPNRGRLDMLDGMIARFKPDVVIDVILHACHGYNVESYKIRQYVQDRHGLPFLKIETDYSAGDVEQIQTRVEALFESR